MNRSPVLVSRFEGIAWLSLFSILTWWFFSGPLSAIHDAERRIEAARLQISQHENSLSKPAEVKDSLRLKSFVTAAADIELLNPGEIQADLIAIIQNHRAKLLDLRILDHDLSIEMLTAHRYRLEFDGDLIATMNIIERMASLDAPVMLESITISPVGNQDRPDRRLRSSLELAFWVEGGSQ